MLKGIIAIVLTFVVTFITTTANAEEYNVNPGMWETTYKMEVSGVPPQMAAMMQQEPKVERECVTGKDIDFSPDDMAKECTFKSTRHSANKVSWDIKCSGEGGNSTGKGEVNFNGNTTSGWFEMNMQGGPMGPMKIRNVFEGKRTGPC
jgi:hypothetical protein